MSTKRQAIESLRGKLRERNADSNYTNQFLYNVLLEHAKWLIKREIGKNNIYSNTFFLQTLRCQDVIETSTIDPCCPIKTNCRIFRTKDKLPELWIDESGPVIRGVTSVDNTTDFWLTTASTWQNKRNNPYQKLSDQKHSFFADDYLWFPEFNPHKVNIVGFWVDDVTSKNNCHPSDGCIHLLDTKFMVPGWVEAEMFAKALEQLAGVSDRLPEDTSIEKNPAKKQ